MKNTNKLLLSGVVLLFAGSAILLSCKKKTYNYACITSVSTVVNDTIYTLIKSDSVFLKGITMKEADKYEFENSNRSTNYGEETKATSCHILLD